MGLELNNVTEDLALPSPINVTVEVEPQAEQTIDVAQCLVQVRQGDEEAARSLIEHFYPLVLKIVRAHLPRRTDEADLTQMIFVKVFRHINQYRGQVPLGHWISRIAVNTCLNQLRAEKCRPELRWADLSEEEEDVLREVLSVSSEPQFSDQFAARELAEKLLEMLSPADRLVITLLDLQQHSVQEIKEMTGLSISVIKVRAFRARRKLRKFLLELQESES